MQINTRVDKPQLCDVAIESTKKLAMALEEIKNGAAEGAVCEKYNIKRRYIRHFIFNNHTIYENKLDIDCVENVNNNEDDFFDQEMLLSGGEKLYKKLEPNEKVPYDADKMVEYFIKNGNLKKKEIKVLRMRYWEDMTLEEVGEKLGVTRERIRQIEAKILRILRKKYHNVIKCGNAAFIKQRNKKMEDYIVEKKLELEKYNKLVQEAKETEKNLALFKETYNEYLENEEKIHQETVEEFIEYCFKNENISARLYNSFSRGMLRPSFPWQKNRPIKDMENYTKSEIMVQIRNLGWKSITELEYLLNKRGIYLKEEG